MFADTDPISPWWVAGGLAVSTLAFAALRVYDAFRKNKIEWDKGQHGLDREVRQELTEEQRVARRDSETEAWKVVDRLTKEVEGHKAEIDEILESHAVKIKDIETRERECTEERAADKMVLRILVTWAKKQKNPPPIPDDVLARLTADGSSSLHLPLPGEPK